MSLKQGVFTALKILLLGVLLTAISTLSTGLLWPQSVSMTLPDDQAAIAGVMFLLVNLIEAALIAYVILRSRGPGLQIAATTALLYYGVKVVMAQIETLFFGLEIMEGFFQGIFLSSAVTTLIFVPLAVLILGRWKTKEGEPTGFQHPGLSLTEWVLKLAGIAVMYLILYFTFGYFIAWQNPELRAFYGATEFLPFIPHMLNVIQTDPQVIGLQVLRSLLWVAVSLPALRLLKSGYVESAVIIGLALALFMNTQHLIPNPLMPPSVRFSHFLETASSNFLFGLGIVWLLFQHHASFADLFRRTPEDQERVSIAAQ